MKLKDVIRPYDGRGCIVDWLDKLKSAADITGEKDLLKVIPLLLEGSAYAVYSQLDSAAKNDVEKIKEALITSFGLDEFDAFDQFCQARWSGGSVDVYAAYLRSLAKQAKVESDEVIRKRLVTSLPIDVSRQLRALVNSTNADLASTIKLSRTLMAQSQSAEQINVTAMASERKRLPFVPSRSRRPIECWKCGKTGHISRWCPQREQGNEQREPCAPAGSQQMERRSQ